eukprot:jgi/Phyca11/16319/fgenesh1_pg.PHYCAscaffold_19_\
MKTDGPDEENLTTFDEATGTVIVGSTVVTDWTDELLEDARERDAERAAVYLATVHPAMASARFSWEEREEAQRRRSAELKRRILELERSKEGANRLRTGEGATVTDGAETLDEDSGTVTSESEVIPEDVSGTVEVLSALDDDGKNDGGNGNSSIAAVDTSSSGDTDGNGNTSCGNGTDKELQLSRRAPGSDELVKHPNGKGKKNDG